MKQGNRRTKLAIFATHPIQYQVPWFRALAAVPDLEVQVYYAMLPDAAQQGAGFGVEFKWDLPLLDGYQWQLLENNATQPSLESFRGCDVRQLTAVLRVEQPDAGLITGWNSLYLLQALWSCRRLSIPTLVRGDSNVLAPRGKLKSRLQHRLIRSYSACLAVGELNRRLYEEAGVDSQRIYFCPHFIDNDRFAQQADQLRPQRDTLRDRWGVPRDAVCFLFVGKLIPKKRVLDFIDGVADAAREVPSIHGLIVGAGEMMEQAQLRVSERKAPIGFTGFLNQQEIISAYVASDCLVLPSDYGETWGLVVNEAMACGLPAIVSDQVGCGPDLVVAARTGDIYPLGDISALAALMERYALSRSSLLGSMGAAASKHTVARYSLSGAVAGLVSALSVTLGVGV